MLSGDILDEFVRPSLLRDDIISLAWPSLTTESKLQILSSLMKNPIFEISDTIFEIAGTDPDPIVRFWLCRNYQVKEILTENEKQANRSDSISLYHRDISPNTVKVAKLLLADSDEFVQDAAAIEVDRLSGPQEALSKRQRLIASRYGEVIGVSKGIEWLKSLIQTGNITEQELRDIVWEFLNSTWISNELKPDEMNRDGMSHFFTVKTGRELWELSISLPKLAAILIGYYAPVIVEKTNILQEVFDTLPPETQAAAIGRNDEGIDEIAEKVALNPDKYDEQVSEALALHDNYAFEMPNQGELREARILASNDKIQELLKLGIKLEKQLADIRQEIELASQPANKGFFSSWR